MKSITSTFVCCLTVWCLSSSPASALTSIGISNTNLVKNGLVGHWTFDGKNMTNATATDSSGSGNNGTLTNMTQANSMTIGKIGQALIFNGSNKSINLATSTSINITGDISVSTWIKPSSYGGGSRGRIIDNGGASPTTGYRFDVDNANVTGGLGFGINVAGTLNVDYLTSNASVVTLNKWQMVTITFSDSTDTVKFYVNGVLQGTKTLNTSILSSNVPVIIGGRNGASDANFDGAIDDLRVYNRTLSATEIQSLYKAGGGTVQYVTPTNSLRGHWSFDNDKMTTVTAIDSSSNRKNGTLANMTSTSSTLGKINKALVFDGVNDWISVPAFGSSPFSNTTFTLAGWFKTTSSASQAIFSQDHCSGGFLVYLSSGVVNFSSRGGGACGPGSVNRSSSSGGLHNGVWHHVAVVVTTDTVTTGNNTVTIYVDGVVNQGSLSQLGVYGQASETHLSIGSRYNGSDYLFNGQLDDLRFYSKGLTSKEISQLYTAGAKALSSVRQAPQSVTSSGSGLVGHWTFDGKNMTNATATDSSGFGNNGTLVNMTQANSKTIGKLGQALNFDNTDDYIRAANFAWAGGSAITISFWNYSPGGINASAFTIGNQNNASTNIIQAHAPDVTNTLYFDYGTNGNGRISTSYANYLNKWTHVVLVNNGSNFKAIYLNGVLVASSSVVATPPTAQTGIWIGAWPVQGAYYHKGKLDDFRVYNQSLSASEIKSLYKLGSQ